VNPERWSRIEEVFHRVVDAPPAARLALIERECSGDADLRASVERLLHADAPGDGIPELDGLGAAHPDPLIGRELGVYRLTSRIATGGMGVVYKAERTDGLFERVVAIKLIRSGAATERALRRFEFERRALAALSHPNIARLYDSGTTRDNNPYLVMEYIAGERIDLHCNDRRLPLQERVRLFSEVCKAVHFAHQNLIVHRDLKPGNILIDEQGAPKILDFGIARLVEAPDAEPTATFDRILTPEYASPEQLAGRAVTTATDVYSLGVILYTLITGQKPFRCESRSPAAWARLVEEQIPRRPSTLVKRRETETTGSAEAGATEFAESCSTTPAKLRQRLAGDLDRIVLTALRKEPERRYTSAQEFAHDIDRHLAGRPVLAREDSVLYVTSKFVRRHRVGVASTALILLTLVAGIVVARREAKRARIEAQHTRIEAASFRRIADFLMDSFVTSEVFESAGRRERSKASILLQAERVRRQHAEAPHLRANLLDALGRVCCQINLFGEGEGLMREALELREKTFGQNSLEFALSLGSLGELEFRRGAFAQSAETLGRALHLHRICPVGTHTDVATAANNLAVALRSIGASEDAERLHLEALELRRDAEDGSLAVAESLNNLAGVHLDRANYQAAFDLLTEAAAIRRSILAEEHPLTLQTYSNLAMATWHRGEHAQARALLEEAETGHRRLDTEGRPGLAKVLLNLGILDMLGSRFAEAEARLGESLDLQVAQLGPDHPNAASVLATLAVLQWRLGRDSEAAVSWGEALRIRRGALPPDHPDLGRTLYDYGAFLVEMGALEEAESMLREAVETLGSGPDPALQGRAELALGECLLKALRPNEAEPLLRSGVKSLESATGISEAELARARAWLRELETRAEDG